MSGSSRKDTLIKDAIAEARRLIGNCVLFEGLSASERSAISALAHIKTYDAGDTIFALGSPGDQMMAILSGAVRISVPSNDGKELLLAIMHPGEVFGEIAVLDGKERSADAVAESACTLGVLDRRDILSFLERNPSVWLKIVAVLCDRLRRTDQVLAEVALMQLPARLAKMMLRITDNSSTAKAEKIRFSQRELASMVGGTRESVNKCLRKWQTSGVVKISESWIVINDRTALEQLAENS
jgi:CRP/FNR family transcriptional regulator, cyclic AMP receptor protein